jgi:hypothetical protein
MSNLRPPPAGFPIGTQLGRKRRVSHPECIYPSLLQVLRVRRASIVSYIKYLADMAAVRQHDHNPGLIDETR